MSYTHAQIAALSREFLRDGFFFYQLNFVWGHTPAIRNRSGSLYYFVADGEILTPADLHHHLRTHWVPSTTAERLFFENRLDAHFTRYPQAVPKWTGRSVPEIFSLYPDLLAVASLA